MIALFYDKIISSGVSSEQNIIARHRLETVNKFCLLCIAYTIPYICFSIFIGLATSAMVFFAAQLFFIAAIYFNTKASFDLANFLIIIGTSCSVFYLSLFYGYSSGFHLYYFTSPLIVGTLYNTNNPRKLIFGLLPYLICILVLSFFFAKEALVIPEISDNITLLYPVNVVLAISFCIMLTWNFCRLHIKANEQLLEKNAELLRKGKLLKSEITERESTEAKLSETIKAREFLLSEMHHRIKNNLALISAMIDLQTFSEEYSGLKRILLGWQRRVKSIGLVHESLNVETSPEVDLKQYLMLLVDHISKAHSFIREDINFSFKLEKGNIETSKAIFAGLIVNEVISNALQHGLKESEKSEVHISYLKENDSHIIRIRDTGRGFTYNKHHEKGTGLTLIDAFTNELQGKFEYYSLNGCEFVLTFND